MYTLITIFIQHILVFNVDTPWDNASSMNSGGQKMGVAVRGQRWSRDGVCVWGGGG